MQFIMNHRGIVPQDEDWMIWNGGCVCRETGSDTEKKKATPRAEAVSTEALDNFSLQTHSENGVGTSFASLGTRRVRGGLERQRRS